PIAWYRHRSRYLLQSSQFPIAPDCRYRAARPLTGLFLVSESAFVYRAVGPDTSSSGMFGCAVHLLAPFSHSPLPRSIALTICGFGLGSANYRYYMQFSASRLSSTSSASHFGDTTPRFEFNFQFADSACLYIAS